jgi:hypothetical protein
MVIEENVRRDMMNKQPGIKASKKVPKATTKPAKTTKKVLKKKQTTVEKSDDTAEPESSSDESEHETEVAKPKRKRPSDYIAEKDRPHNLKSDKKLNELNLEEAIQICKLSAKRAKMDTTSMDADDKPEKKTCQKFKDDGLSKLHPARFERQPLAPPTQWWSQVPTRRTSVIKKIPLRHLGN